MCCSVRGNAGTVAEHLVLSEIIRGVCEGDCATAGSCIHYVDTHAMCPLNIPQNAEGIFARLWGNGVPKDMVELSPFLQIAETSRSAKPAGYPSHVVFASKTASTYGRKVWATLFEVCQDKWPHVATFLEIPETVPGQRLDRESVRGTLGRGSFRDQGLWAQAKEAMKDKKPSARLVFSDPWSYSLGGRRVRPDRMNLHDLRLIRQALPEDGLPTCIIIFTSVQIPGALPGYSATLASEVKRDFFNLETKGADYQWFMVRTNNQAVFAGCSGFGDKLLSNAKPRISSTLDAMIRAFGLRTAVDWMSGAGQL